MSEWRREKAYHLATEFMADIDGYPRWQEDKDALEESIFKGLEEAEARGRRLEREAHDRAIEQHNAKVEAARLEEK